MKGSKDYLKVSKSQRQFFLKAPLPIGVSRKIAFEVYLPLISKIFRTATIKEMMKQDFFIIINYT